MKKAFTFLILLFSLCLTGNMLLAQKTNCVSKPNVASEKLRELVSVTLKQDFQALRAKLESSWSENKNDREELLSALRDIESYKSFSKDITEQEICTEGKYIANGYYKNNLTNAVDRIRIVLGDSATGSERITKIRVNRAFRFWDIPSQNLSNKQRIQMLESYVTGLTDANAFAGTVLIAQHGRILYHKSFGKRYDDIVDTISLADPFNPSEFSNSFRQANVNPKKAIEVNDRFNLASLNKIFTAVAILQLVEKGKLSLEDSMVKIMPDEVKSKEAGAIRVKHLLSHTSGMSGFTLDKLSFTPGSKFSYNNMNFAYLGEVIERITGMRYEDYLRINILGPLGMANTALYKLKKMTSSIVIGDYEDIRDGNYVLEPNPYLQKYPGSAMGGMYSTAEDLFKFGEALRTYKLVKPETVKQMRTAKTELNAPEYGYGILLWQGPGIWGHSGRLPGADADLEIFGDTGIVAIVLSNKSNANEPVQAKIRSLFFAQSLNAK